MSNLENNFSIYPYGYEDELTKKRATAELQAIQLDEERNYLVERIGRPADATVRNIGDLAIQSMTGGILQPTFDTESHTAEPTVTPELARKFGAPVRHLVSVDQSPLLSSVKFEQEATALNEQAILGYAERQAA